MTAKEYLLQAYLLDQRIDGKLEQVEALRSLATKSNAIIRSNPGSGGGNNNFMEDVVIKIVDLEKEITAESDTGNLQREIYVQLVNALADSEAPYYYYVSFMKSSSDYWALLLDPVTGEVISKKV